MNMNKTKHDVVHFGKQLDERFGKLRHDVVSAVKSPDLQSLLINAINNWQMGLKKCLAMVLRSLSAFGRQSGMNQIFPAL